MPNFFDIPAVQTWLAQFDEEDVPHALTMLKSLRRVSADSFHLEISGLLDGLVEQLDAPLALYAAREIKPANASYFINKRNRPLAVLGEKQVGSEGAMLTVATSATRRDNRFLNHPPVMTLRRRRCQHIVILDDFVGSGERVRKFIQSLLRTDSVKSWRWKGYIKFHIVAYGITEYGRKNILKSLGRKTVADGISFYDTGLTLTLDQMVDKSTLACLENVCVKYGKRAKMKWNFIKGFHGKLGSIVFTHGCPNNAAGILWNSTLDWKPLFPNRAIPQKILEQFVGKPRIEECSILLSNLDAADLARSKAFLKGSNEEHSLLLVLSAIKKKFRKGHQISLATNIPKLKVEKLLERCREFGLLDKNNILTPSGRHGLRSASKLKLVEDIHCLPTDELYFPRIS